MNILIVDDKEENLYLLEALLSGSGYEVVSAKNGVEALEKLKRDSFDLIISDILMPKMDGFQLCRECKSDDVLKQIPFVFYTATYTDEKDEELALSLGAEKFIVKPQEPNVFLEILKSVIKERIKRPLVAPKRPIEEETVYLEEYNKRLIKKLEKKMLDLEKEVDERKKVEEKIYQQNEFLKNVLEALTYPFYVIDANDYTIKMANSAAGIGDLSQNPTCYASTHGGDKPCVGEHICPLTEVKKIKKPVVTEHIHYDKDGNLINVEVHGYPIFDNEGKAVQMIEYSLDITERKKTEEKILNLAKFPSENPNPVLRISAEGSILYMNASVGTILKIKGLSEEEIFKILPRNLKELIDKVLKTGKLLSDLEVKIGERTYSYSMIPVVENRYVNLYALNITDRKQAEDTLEKERNLLRTLIDNLPDFIYVKNTESRFVTVNTAVTQLMGAATPGELIGKTDFDFYPKELAEKFYTDEQEIVYSGQAVINQEEPGIDSAGNSVWRLTTKVPLRDERGKIVGIIGIGRDITDHKQMDEELRKLSLAVEQSPVSIVITDIKGNIEYVNPKFTELTGYTYNEVIGKNPRILKSGEYTPKFYKELWDTITSGKEWRGELHNKKKNGELYWEHASISPIKDKEGVITHYLGVMEDITEIKHLEMQLIQAQKMEAIGTLAGGVAHDFNNLLTVVIGYSDFMLSKLDKQNEMYGLIDQIRKAGRRAASVAQQLLAFSRKQILKPQVLELNTVIAEMEKMLRRLIGEDIELITVYEPDLKYVKADQGQVEQVLMNLVVNARDAMVDGGRLALKTENVTIDEQYCKLNSEARPGNFICFSVEDSGIGMDKETISHIFEPFFTTKEIGTGLGLSVIYGIVKQHEGWINVYSEPGQGSTFKVYFPVISVKEDKKDEEKISIEELRGSGERVLLVEDDDLLIEYAKGALSNNGYKVFEVKNAKEALDIFEKEEGNFDIVFSDVVLPDKNGVELVEMLVSHKPGIKVLLSSGYLDDKSQWAKIQEKGFTFIQKPYTMAELLKAIKDVIKPN